MTFNFYLILRKYSFMNSKNYSLLLNWDILENIRQDHVLIFHLVRKDLQGGKLQCHI